MNNRIKITTDGINAFATICVSASKVGIRILVGCIVFEIFILIGLFSQLKAEEVTSTVIPVILAAIIFLSLPLKYLSWNLYGKEDIIINSKSISWSYDYGFFKTNLETIKIDRLGLGYEKVRTNDIEEIGRLLFYNYRAKDNLPEMVHQTTVLLSLNDIKEFSNQIDKIYENEFFNENGFIPFSLN